MKCLGLPFKRRTFGRVTHFSGFRGVFYWDKSVEVLQRGVVERVLGIVDGGVLKSVPSPVPGAFRQLASFRSAVLRRCCRVPRDSRAAYVASFSGSQRAVYASAAASLEIEPLNSRDYKTTIFPKAEKTRKASRAIIFSSPRMNVELGRYLKPSEHNIYRAIGGLFGYTVVMKGKNLIARARHIREATEHIGPNWVGVMLDAAKFDAHISQDALTYEHSFYEGLFPCDSELQRYLKAQLVLDASGRCKDGMLTVKKPGNRCSGCVNTSLGNVIIMVAMIHGFLAEHSINARLVNDGDDSVLFIHREDLPRLLEAIGPYFLRFGFTMRVDGVADILEQVVFCQSRPVYDGVGWTMIRDPAKAIGQDLCSTRIVTIQDARRHCSAVGTCGGSLSRGIPVLQAFYAANRAVGINHGRLLKDPALRREGFAYFARFADISSPMERVITDASRLSFARAFGILPSTQVRLERHFMERAKQPLLELNDHTISLSLSEPTLPVVLPDDDNSWVFCVLNDARPFL